ncbi:MAG: hypothetical protein WBG57_05025 [Ornithinimicrobium sp.]
MKIVDAVVIVELLAGDLDPELLGEEELAAPHLIDSEVTHVLRVLSTGSGSANSKVTSRSTASRSPDFSPIGSVLACGHSGTGSTATTPLASPSPK